MRLRKPAAWLLIAGVHGLTNLSVLQAALEDGQVEVTGESKLWHRIILDCGGPMTDEKASPNPFAANDPYRHPVVIHSYPDKKQQMYPALLGDA